MIQLPSLERIDGTEYGRLYKTPDGNLYPSVTTVFSVLENKFLDEWRARIGEEEARKITTRAARRGTFIHAMAEELLTGRAVEVTPNAKMLYGDQWRKFKPLVEKIEECMAVEAKLYSDVLKVAGTVDCVGVWEGKPAIIDFKTSSRIKTHDSIDSYWMQCAAYSRMWFERTGQKIDDLVILMSVEDEEPLVFKDKASNWLDRFVGVRVKYKKVMGI